MPDIGPTRHEFRVRRLTIYTLRNVHKLGIICAAFTDLRGVKLTTLSIGGKHMTSVMLVAFCVAIVPSLAAAKGEPNLSSEVTKQAGVGALPENFELVAFPIVAYTPETNILFAAASLVFFDLSKDPSVRRSDVMATAAYSLNGQAVVQIRPNLYFDNGVHIRGEVVFLDWSTEYFGIGDQGGQEQETFNNQQLETELVLDWEPFRNFFAGFAGEFGYNSLRIDPDTELFDPSVPGIDGGILVGTGVRAEYDTRDTTFATRRGQRFAAEATYFNTMIGSDFDYWKLRLDARQFFSWGEHTLGLHGVTRVTVGDPPFYDMSTIGGYQNLRGIFRGRFLDNNMFVVQGEYRTPYLWRFGLAGFAGIGDTFKHVADLRVSDLKWAAGGGLRVLLKEKERVNLRLDAGVSADDWGVYLGIGEAF